MRFNLLRGEKLCWAQSEAVRPICIRYWNASMRKEPFRRSINCPQLLIFNLSHKTYIPIITIPPIVSAKMAGYSDEPHPDDILTLGALSQVPEDNEASTAAFDFATSITDILGSATASVINASANVYAFQGLAAVRFESTLIAQVAGRATEIDDFNPPVWYLNFPLKMNDAALQNLRDHAQTMHDFKCWLSMKWWANVFQLFPTDLGIFNKMIQSTAFVQVAMKDLPQSPMYVMLLSFSYFD